MNPNWHDLIQRHMAGLTSEEEAVALQDLLKQDDNAARLYLRYTNLDLALESKAASAEASRELLTAPAPKLSSRWFSWRPLSAAAAGLAIGLFSASLVYGFVSQRHVRVETVLSEGFEKADMPIESGVPERKNVWAGELLPPQGANELVSPAEGKLMGVLMPHDRRKLSYGFRFLDVDRFPAAVPGETRQIEVTARFHSGKPEVRDRFQICLAAFSEDVTEAREIWNRAAVDEQALLHVTRTVKTEPDAFGWVTLQSVIDVPDGTKSLLVSLAAGVVHGDKTKTEHYLDDVQVRLITSNAALP